MCCVLLWGVGRIGVNWGGKTCNLHLGTLVGGSSADQPCCHTEEADHRNKSVSLRTLYLVFLPLWQLGFWEATGHCHVSHLPQLHKGCVCVSALKTWTRLCCKLLLIYSKFSCIENGKLQSVQQNGGVGLGLGFWGLVFRQLPSAGGSSGALNVQCSCC